MILKGEHSGRSRKGEAQTQTRMAIQTEMTAEANRKLISYINVKLALLGAAVPAEAGDSAFSEIASALVARYREEERLLASYLCPADQRIQTFLYDYLQDVPVAEAAGANVRAGSPGAGARCCPAGGSGRISVPRSSIRIG